MTEVSDFFLAVYLLASGEQLIDLQVQPKEIFLFAVSPSLQSHIDTYRADTALVNPKMFARKIMELRQQLKQRHDATA
jgi:hypothetical protein